METNVVAWKFTLIFFYDVVQNLQIWFSLPRHHKPLSIYFTLFHDDQTYDINKIHPSNKVNQESKEKLSIEGYDLIKIVLLVNFVVNYYLKTECIMMCPSYVPNVKSIKPISKSIELSI